MRKIILFSVLIVSAGFFIFTIQNKGIIFQKEKAEPNLLGFYKLTREDPLFYSPFFDSKEFEKAILELEESDDQLKKVVVENLEATAGAEKDYYIPILKENGLFPYQFLKNLILINQGTKEFLKSPSLELGEKLLELYNNASDSYIQDISSKIKIFETIESYKPAFKTQDVYFFFVDSVSSFRVVKNDFLTIKENGDKLKEETEKRKNCLLGKESCEALLKTKDNSSFIGLMGNEKFNLQGEKIDFIKNNLPDPPWSEAKGPYKINSLCWRGPNLEHWLYFIYFKRGGRTLFIPKLATQNYYTKVSPGDAVNKALSEKGLPFYLQSEATTYQCMDLTFYPQLLALDFLKEQIKSGQVIKEDLEKKSDYKLLMENQFGLMVPAINTVSAYLETIKLFQAINKIPESPESLFSIRTAYSIFYFPFAKSIWRIDKQLQYFVPEKEKPLAGDSPFVTLDELEKLGYSKEKIKNFYISPSQTEFLNSLLR